MGDTREKGRDRAHLLRLPYRVVLAPPGLLGLDARGEVVEGADGGAIGQEAAADVQVAAEHLDVLRQHAAGCARARGPLRDQARRFRVLVLTRVPDAEGEPVADERLTRN